VTQFVLFYLRAESQLVDVVDDLAQVVAALDLVLDFTENLTDFVFDSVRPAGLLLEVVKIRKELDVHEVAKVIAGLCLVVIKLPVFAPGRGPFLPTIGLVEDEGVLLPPSAASSALSCSNPSRYFRKRSHEVCSV
jgi:hypothetical protein